MKIQKLNFFAVFFTICSLFIVGCQSSEGIENPKTRSKTKNLKNSQAQTKVSQARNILLFIGDGMGDAHITLARLMEKKKLFLDSFPVLGKLETFSLSNVVTDSAASATAMATGWKTLNGVLGMAPGKGKKLVPVQSLMEWLRGKGYSVGVVTTTRITHATPAAFLSHVERRYWEKKVARQYLKSGAQLFFGGGKKYFNKSLLRDFQKNGYRLVFSEKDLMKLHTFEKVLALFSRSHIPFELERSKEPSLLEMTKKAVELLEKGKRPFFLMVEGGRIDHGAHIHDAASVWRQLVGFDRAVGWAKDWAAKREDTLVVVTADHATGGLAVSKNFRPQYLKSIRHSAEELAKRVQRGEEAEALLRKLGYIQKLTKREKQWLKLASLQKNGYLLAKTIGHILSRRAGVYFYPLEYGSFKGFQRPEHSGVDVSLYAFGPGEHLFGKTMLNSKLPIYLAKALGEEFHPQMKTRKRKQHEKTGD
ncbi:MAG: alkaline phosphatase [Planctomycetota bacterium]|nr:MAG: alkaline phosphatase [Planctomycetota bacterium]